MNRIFATMMALLVCGVTTAATINVPADYTTIQAAVDAASGGDVILVAPGTYTGTGDEVANTHGKAITIKASGTPEETILDGEGARGVVRCISGEGTDTIIEGFTIMGGYGPYGGGIYCGNGDSNPTITDCTISDNTATNWGGGIYCWGSSPTITSCTISGNTAANDGGAIYCSNGSNPTLNYTVICDNGGGQVGCDSGTDCYTNNGSGISDDCGTSSVIVAMGLQIQNLSTNMAQQQATIEAQQSAITDLQKVVEACCSSKCAGDHDNNGHINVEDLLHIMANWGPCP